MSLKGIAVAAVILAASEPPPAAACHHYSRWYYPWPQQCGVGRVALHKIIVTPNRNDSAPNRNDFAIPLPALTIDDYGGGQPSDEVTGARLQLLGYAHAQ